MRTQFVAALAVAFCTAISSVAFANDVGVVETVQQTAYGTAPSAAKAQKHEGDPVAHRELLETSDQGGMLVRFTDGSKLTLGAESKLMVVAFAYQAEDSNGNAVISIPAGTLRYVTGAMPKGHTIIYTPLATMTLNGTNVTVGVNADGDTHLFVAEGTVTVHSRTTGKDTTVAAGEGVDITPQGMTTSAQSATGDAMVDHGLTM